MDTQGIRELVAKIEAGLRARSEGSEGSYPDYEEDRDRLFSVVDIHPYIPDFLRDSPNAEIAFGFMRNHASGGGSWGLRREYVSNGFANLRTYITQIASNAPLLSYNDILEISVLPVSRQLSIAKRLIASDPASAITKAETVLAGICKHILEREGVSLSKRETLPSLVSKVARDILNMEFELGISNFSGISNQAQLVAEIRNRYSDAHPSPDPDSDLAELAVTIAGALSIFLLKRYERRVNSSV